jgi:hypothetical protein
MAWPPTPGMKMPRRYRAEVAESQQPRTTTPSWLAPVCQVCLSKPETNSCARPRKAGQKENPQADPTDFRVSVSSDELLGSAFVQPNEARHIQTAFPSFAKRPGTPPPPENDVSPGLLVRHSCAPALPTMFTIIERLQNRYVPFALGITDASGSQKVSMGFQ